MKVFDAELFAIEKAFKLALDQMSFYTKDIWVFSDSQAAIQRIQKSDINADQSHVLAIENWTAKIKAKYQDLQKIYGFSQIIKLQFKDCKTAA